MANISFLPSDSKTPEERLVGQNSSLRSIQGNEINNVRELQLETTRQEAALSNLLALYSRISQSLVNLTRAVELLTDLEQSLMIGTKQGATVVAIINDWKSVHGDSFE